MRSLPLILLILAGCSTYVQHRAALVPHAAPVPFDGQPLETQGELTLGADNLVDLVQPQVGNPTQGDVIPAQQLRGAAAVRVSDNVSIAGVYEHAIASTATVVSPSEPPIKNATLAGGGLQVSYSMPTGTPGLRIGIAGELVVWHVPWVEYTTCVQNCVVNGYTYSNTGATNTPTAGLAVIPSYRHGRMIYFGGVTVRNHPTITEKTTTNLPDQDGDVQDGPLNVTLHAGIGVDVGSGVRANLFVHQTVTRDPIAYGPAIGMTVSIPLGDRAQPGTPGTL